MTETKQRVAVTRLIPSVGLQLLEEHFEIEQWESDAPPDREVLIKLLQNKDGALTLLSDRIDGELLDMCPNLKVIGNMAVGYENIDPEAAAERGVWVTNTPDVLTDATADIALSLILSVTRRIVESDKFMRAGKYHYWEPRMLRGTGLADKTLGIIGFGRIGKAVAHRARAFGMKIIFTDPVADETNNAKRVELDELLGRSDIVSLHCPYSDDLFHLIDDGAFRKMKNSAYFINTARGKLMDEKALVNALKEGEIAGAGLDVYENEPAFQQELAGFDNVVMLPHIGSATHETRDAMASLAAKNIIEVLHGRDPLTPVNKPRNT